MANYSYQSSSYSSGGGAGDAEAAFQEADANRDGRLDINEFRNFLGRSASIGGGGGGGYSAGSSFESAAYGVGGGAGASESTYESSAFGSSLNAGLGGGVAGGLAAGASGYESSSFSSGGYGADAGFVAGGAVGVGGAAGVSASSYESSSSSAQVEQYTTDAQGLFKDPNPQIIRRAAIGGVQVYTQNIRVRFLQPPPIPPPGPLIIKEVRPPQPPPPPPLRIRQQAPPLPPPPPLILREKPPPIPASTASQTVIRRLAALAVPPRSVIIERLPPLPPRPRDIIIERWVPYGAQAKRRTIVQRAAAAQQYARPRNIIIQYEPVQVRIIRQFQRLGVTQANPQAYVQQYGAQLLDAATLLQQARAAGVVEDISPPAGTGAVGFSSSSYGQEASFSASSGSEVGTGLVAGGAGSAGGVGGGYSASSYESASYSSGGAGGLEAGLVAGGGSGGYGASASSLESSNFSSGVGGGYGVAGGYGLGGGAEGAFSVADINRDGSIDQNEFRNFLAQTSGDGLSSSFSSSSVNY